MSRSESKSSCEQIAPLFVFYLCNEIDQKERAAVDQHLAACPSCRTQLAEEQKFSDSFAAIPQAADELDNAGILLSRCRSELAEKLDDLAHPPVKSEALRFAWFRRWMIIHPAWSGAALIIFGLVLGTQSRQWFTPRGEAGSMDHAVNIRPETELTDDQLSKMAVAGINLTPSSNSGMQNVRLQLSAQEPVVLTGNLDDSDVRRVLTYVVKNGEKFNSGVRLDCLDALKASSQDAEVRGALLEAARKDPNPAVRLKALEALRDSASDLAVRQALLDSLQHDANPGVRVEAVNLLVRSLEQANAEALAPLPPLPGGPRVVQFPESDFVAPDARKSPDESMVYMIQTLEHLQHKDPSRYVRLQSAVALRQIDERREH
jgi:HEAT repeats/Putative zinc-finger